MKIFLFILQVLAVVLTATIAAPKVEALTVPPPPSQNLHTLTVANGIVYKCDGTGDANSAPHVTIVKVPHNAQIRGAMLSSATDASWQDTWVSTTTDIFISSHKVGPREWNLQADSPPEWLWFGDYYYTAADGLVYVAGWCSNDQTNAAIGAAASGDFVDISAAITFTCPQDQCS